VSLRRLIQAFVHHQTVRLSIRLSLPQASNKVHHLLWARHRVFDNNGNDSKFSGQRDAQACLPTLPTWIAGVPVGGTSVRCFPGIRPTNLKSPPSHRRCSEPSYSSLRSISFLHSVIHQPVRPHSRHTYLPAFLRTHSDEIVWHATEEKREQTHPPWHTCPSRGEEADVRTRVTPLSSPKATSNSFGLRFPFRKQHTYTHTHTQRERDTHTHAAHTNQIDNRRTNRRTHSHTHTHTHTHTRAHYTRTHTNADTLKSLLQGTYSVEYTDVRHIRTHTPQRPPPGR
jgi:hypothetical protein